MANRNYPQHTLKQALVVAQKIKDVYAGGRGVPTVTA